MALIVVDNTSRSEFIKHLKRYGSTNNQVRSPVRSQRTFLTHISLITQEIQPTQIELTTSTA